MKKLLQTSIAFIVMSLLVVSGLWMFFGTKAQTANNVFVTFGVDKTQAIPGDVLTYTLYVKNNTSSDITNVNAATSIDSKVTYVAGSSMFHKGSQTLALPDSWLTDRLNMGTIVPGQENSVIYKVTVPANTATGTSITSSGQIQPEGMNAQAYQVSTTIVPANQTAILRGGEFLKVRNNTLQTAWADSLTIDPFQVAEFILKITNDGNNPARNVHISANLPANNLITQNPTVTLTADNAESITDGVSVTSSVPFHLSYKLGHATLIGNTGLYNCPTGCVIPDSFYLSPLNLGTIDPGESLTIQVGFKADVIPSETPSPTPTLTPTPTPTVTPTPSGSPTPTPSNTPNVTPTPTPTPVVTPQVLGTIAPTVLPATGSDDGLFIAIAAIPTIIGGVYLYRKFKLV